MLIYDAQVAVTVTGGQLDARADLDTLAGVKSLGEVHARARELDCAIIFVDGVRHVN